MGELARGYSWPPFERGNTAAQKHGAWSERSWRPIADALVEELASSAPWTAKPTYASTVAAWSRTEAQLLLLGNYLDEVGLLDGDEPRAATSLQGRLEAQAQALRSELGLSPLALARLMSVAERRGGGSHHDPARDEIDRELRRLVAEGRAVLENVRDEVARLTDRVVGELEGGEADDEDN